MTGGTVSSIVPSPWFVSYCHNAPMSAGIPSGIRLKSGQRLSYIAHYEISFFNCTYDTSPLRSNSFCVTFEEILGPHSRVLRGARSRLQRLIPWLWSTSLSSRLKIGFHAPSLLMYPQLPGESSWADTGS